MPSPFFIVGPTAVGKTEVAVRAAELSGAEIVNADAFQVYEGLGCLTAKPFDQDLMRVPHRLIGHVSRLESYNVARYHAEATGCLDDAAARARPVIVVGGSGLYVKSLTHGFSPLPPARPELRAELENEDLPMLATRLELLDPVAAKTIDRSNKRRLIRAVEVCLVTGGRFSEQQTAWKIERAPIHGVFFVRERSALLERIDRRTEFFLGEESLEEVRQALHSPLSETAARVIGLAEIGAFLGGGMGRSECLERIRVATRRFAKRQMTWFRAESFEETIDLSTGHDTESCARSIAGKILAAPLRSVVR